MASCWHRRLPCPQLQEGVVIEDGWMDGFMIEKKCFCIIIFHLPFTVITAISLRNKNLMTTCSLIVLIAQFSKPTLRKGKNFNSELHNNFDQHFCSLQPQLSPFFNPITSLHSLFSPMVGRLKQQDCIWCELHRLLDAHSPDRLWCLGRSQMVFQRRGGMNGAPMCDALCMHEVASRVCVCVCFKPKTLN